MKKHNISDLVIDVDFTMCKTFGIDIIVVY